VAITEIDDDDNNVAPAPLRRKRAPLVPGAGATELESVAAVTEERQPSGSFDAPINDVAPNPWNTRDVKLRPQKIKELAASMQRLGKQLQTCPVVTREAYLRIFPAADYPAQAAAVGSAPYVQVPGARRRAALQHLSWPTIRIEVDDSLAQSQEKFIDATHSENDDREPLDPIEEARAIKLEVDFSPSVAAVARKRKCSDAVIFQKLHLLELHPEVQDAIRADAPTPRLPVGEVRKGRKWHEEPAEVQLELLAEWRRRNDPAYKPERAAPKPALSRTRKVLLRLGETVEQMASATYDDLSPEERDAHEAAWMKRRSEDQGS
jgi:ParB/RepB/Spo0J family partition protein